MVLTYTYPSQNSKGISQNRKETFEKNVLLRFQSIYFWDLIGTLFHVSTVREAYFSKMCPRTPTDETPLAGRWLSAVRGKWTACHVAHTRHTHGGSGRAVRDESPTGASFPVAATRAPSPRRCVAVARSTASAPSPRRSISEISRGAAMRQPCCVRPLSLPKQSQFAANCCRPRRSERPEAPFTVDGALELGLSTSRALSCGGAGTPASKKEAHCP